MANLVRRVVSNWRERHQNPTSFWIHLFGIPATIIGIAIAVAGSPWVGLQIFIVGYYLQWMAHFIEGNDMGELILLKRLVRLPYIAIIPWRNTPP